MGIFFSSSNLGLFSIAKQIITIPITFIEEMKSAIAEKSASSDISNELTDLMLILLKKTIFIFTALYLLLALYGGYYFEIVFGKEYILAGYYAQILSISGYFLLLSTPMISLFSILEREDLRLKFSIFNILSRVLPIIIFGLIGEFKFCLLYTSDAADE